MFKYHRVAGGVQGFRENWEEQSLARLCYRFIVLLECPLCVLRNLRSNNLDFFEFLNVRDNFLNTLK